MTDDGLQSSTILVYPVVLVVAMANHELAIHVFDALQQRHPPGTHQILVDGSNPSPKHAVHGDAQCSRFSIHRATATDHEVGMPHEIQAVHHVLGNNRLPRFKQLGPRLPDALTLALVPGKHDQSYVRTLA